MYQVIVYRNKKSRIAKKGSYQECIDWMCQRAANLSPISLLTGWELKNDGVKREVDMSKHIPMGKITPSWLRDIN